MVTVKPSRLMPMPDHAELHVAALAGRLLEVVRTTQVTRELDGLRNAHFRLLSWVPPTGTTHTELASALLMTKQAVGQFVAQLQASGHLEVATDEQDRRRRVVRRTGRGDRVVQEVDAVIGALEQHWSDLVGPERYGTFRGVLEQIARAQQPDRAPPTGGG
jgi:DNA-binding MarR family transcriptional regulator